MGEPEQDAFRRELDGETSRFLARQRNLLADIAADAVELVDSIARLTSGGKKLRAMLCYWGWRGAGGDPGSTDIVRAGVALELFQAAALIHDDIIDRSDTRRGSPSVHRQFHRLHENSRWHLDAGRFGTAAALLTGDMCLSFSEEQFTAVGEPAAAGTRAREIFNRMRSEVMAGQYLDLLEEAVGPERTPQAAAERARTIVRYKSAKYSMEHPLALGGALAGAPEELLSAYSGFALPLGEAFQLRDDILGVFGDPRVTGKPAGDDLREGKRTVLIAQALAGSGHGQRDFINSSLGRADLDEDGIDELRRIIRGSGALDHVEGLITSYSDAAFAALDDLQVDQGSLVALSRLAEAAVARTA